MIKPLYHVNKECARCKAGLSSVQDMVTHLSTKSTDGTVYAYRESGQKKGVPVLFFTHLSANLGDPRGGEGIKNVTNKDMIRAIFTLKDIKTYLFFTRTENGK